jgi:hypothetical protein
MDDSIHAATRGTWSSRSALHRSRLPAHPQPHHRHVTLAFFGQGEVASDASTQLIPRPVPTPILAGYRFPPRHVPRGTCSGTDTRFELEEQKGDGQGPASISTGQGPGHWSRRCQSSTRQQGFEPSSLRPTMGRRGSRTLGSDAARAREGRQQALPRPRPRISPVPPPEHGSPLRGPASQSVSSITHRIGRCTSR